MSIFVFKLKTRRTQEYAEGKNRRPEKANGRLPTIFNIKQHILSWLQRSALAVRKNILFGRLSNQQAAGRPRRPCRAMAMCSGSSAAPCCAFTFCVGFKYDVRRYRAVLHQADTNPPSQPARPEGLAPRGRSAMAGSQAPIKGPCKFGGQERQSQNGRSRQTKRVEAGFGGKSRGSKTCRPPFSFLLVEAAA